VATTIVVAPFPKLAESYIFGMIANHTIFLALPLFVAFMPCGLKLPKIISHEHILTFYFKQLQKPRL
jgi:hypothetical protein